MPFAMRINGRLGKLGLEVILFICSFMVSERITSVLPFYLLRQALALNVRIMVVKGL